MWKLEKQKESNQRQDMNVVIKARELEYNGAPDVQSLIIAFKACLEAIPQTNTFSANMLYRMKQKSEQVAEVWKLTADGNEKYLFFTMTKQQEKFNPFNF